MVTSTRMPLNPPAFPTPPPARPPARSALAATNSRLHYVDCHLPLLLSGGGASLNGTMMDTALPTAAGYDAMLKCWNAAIDRILQPPSSR